MMKRLYEQHTRAGVPRLRCAINKPWTSGWRFIGEHMDVGQRRCSATQYDVTRHNALRCPGRRPRIRASRPDAHDDFLGLPFRRSHRFAYGLPPASAAEHRLRAWGYEECGF
jgi:hypothetical protein